MKFVLSFCPEVEDDMVAGFQWYEAKSPGLGEEFLRAFDSAAEAIRCRPRLCPERERGFRRRLLRRFPYAIYYTIHEREIMVSGLIHCARDPENIGRVLQDRSEQ